MASGGGRDGPEGQCGGHTLDGEADSCINDTHHPWAALASHLQNSQEPGFQTMLSRGRVWAFF